MFQNLPFVGQEKPASGAATVNIHRQAQSMI